MASAAPGTPGALRVGSVLGVPVELSPSWFLFAGLVVLSYGPTLADPGAATRGYLAAAAFALLLLGSVLLHEVGHCVAARMLRLRVRRISVSFLAGATEVVDPPPTPGKAYAVSIAGPLVSVLLTGVGLLGVELTERGTDVRSVVLLFALSNGGLAVFNLLPGLPLDGGGVLRALVWKLSGDPHRATVVAAHAGRVLALLVVPLLALVPPLLGLRLSTLGLVTSGFVAVFLWAGATASLRAATVEGRFAQVTAGDLARPALVVPADQPLATALARAHEAGLHAMVVVDPHGRASAVVSEASVAAVPAHRRPWVAVGDLARPLEPGLLLDPALTGPALLAALRQTPASEYVLRGAEPRVLVTADLERVAAGPATPVAARPVA